MQSSSVFGLVILISFEVSFFFLFPFLQTLVTFFLSQLHHILFSVFLLLFDIFISGKT